MSDTNTLEPIASCCLYVLNESVWLCEVELRIVSTKIVRSNTEKNTPNTAPVRLQLSEGQKRDAGNPYVAAEPSTYPANLPSCYQPQSLYFGCNFPAWVSCCGVAKMIQGYLPSSPRVHRVLASGI